jgi:glyoxylate reductase
MTKPKVFVSRDIPKEGLELISANCELELWQEDTPTPREILLEKVRGKDGIVCMLSDRIDAELMEHAGRQLRVVSNYAVGYDNIDVQAANERDIMVCNTPGVLTDATADLAFALLLAAARRVGEGIDYVKAGNWKTWKPKLLLGQNIYNATLGIIGMGEIGRAVAKRAEGFNMKIIYYDHKHRADLGQVLGAKMCNSIEDLLKEADYISLHVPLSNNTRHLINEKSLKMMKQSAILINTSRGGVVDPRALYNALKNNDIAYAALDVTEPEPIPPNHELLTLPNCLIVPHIGSATVVTRAKMAVLAAQNLIHGLAGKKPEHIVNPEVLK